VLLNTKIRQVTEDIIKLDYNTAVAGIMELLNGLMKKEDRYQKAVQTVLQLLSPFAPFITHELWEMAGGEGMISDAPWPRYDPGYIQEDIITFVVQVNGKIRDTVDLPINTEQGKVKEEALKSRKIQKYLDKKRIIREIFVKNKLINIVTRLF
jgi:leucyl-tRNA synthetase